MDRQDVALDKVRHPDHLVALRDRGVTALMLAAWCGNVEMIRLLCDAGADVNQLEFRSRGPLHVAVKEGHLAAAAALIEAGADVNGGKAETPLMYAVETRRTSKTPRVVKELVALLLSHGAKPSITAAGRSVQSFVAESGLPDADRRELFEMLRRG